MHVLRNRLPFSLGGGVTTKQPDARHWLALAHEAWAQAKDMNDPDARLEMLAVAAAYQRRAVHTEERTASQKPRH